MRIKVVSALYVLFPLIYIPNPAAAQSNPPSPLQSRPSVQQLPSTTKLLDFQRGDPLGRLKLRQELENKLSNRPRANDLLNDSQGHAGAIGIQKLAPGSQCAPILEYQAPRLDRKMILEIPREFSSNMPMLEGLQPCCSDFRTLWMTPRAAPFLGDSRIGAFLPPSLHAQTP
jgi:hypothetical protein